MNFRDALQQNDGNYLGAFQELGTRKIPINCLIPAGNHQSSRSLILRHLFDQWKTLRFSINHTGMAH